MNCVFIQNTATGIWTDISEPTNLSVSAIETKLLSSGFIGQFDALINGCHHVSYDTGISGYCVSPSLNGEEVAIFQQLYLTNYYAKRSSEVLSLNNGLTAGAWVEIVEADTRIRRANPNEIAKFYKDLYKEFKSNLDDMISAYNRNQSNARSVDYFSIDQYGSRNPLSDGPRTDPI